VNGVCLEGKQEDGELCDDSSNCINYNICDCINDCGHNGTDFEMYVCCSKSVWEKFDGYSYYFCPVPAGAACQDNNGISLNRLCNSEVCVNGVCMEGKQVDGESCDDDDDDDDCVNNNCTGGTCI